MFRNFYGGAESAIMLSLLMAAAKKKRREMTPEEREAQIKRIAENKEMRRVRDCILNNKCPNDDGGHLIRGKKDKKNGYKRGWKCDKCGKTFFMPEDIFF